MSTRFTYRGTPMVDSYSLRLALATAEVRDAICDHVAMKLAEKGYEDVSPATLNFLGALDCGVNYGSEIARSLNVSRQFVAKMVRELAEAGYLEQKEGVGRQKQILFTKKGEKLMSEVRKILADLDSVLIDQEGEAILKKAIKVLEKMKTLL